MQEALYFAAMGATAVIALVANLGRFRKTRSLQRHAELVHEQLVAWAAETDWRIADGSDVRSVDDAERLTGLAGFPGDWNLRISRDKRERDEYAPIKKWVYGTFLTRDTAFGRVTIIGCWREQSTTYNVFAALSGASHSSPFTIDVLEGSAPIRDGTPPPTCDEAELRAALAELAAPGRLRFLGGEILIHTTSWLSAELAEDLCRRLLALYRVLPHGPSLGPER